MVHQSAVMFLGDDVSDEAVAKLSDMIFCC